MPVRFCGFVRAEKRAAPVTRTDPPLRFAQQQLAGLSCMAKQERWIRRPLAGYAHTSDAGRTAAAAVKADLAHSLMDRPS